MVNRQVSNWEYKISFDYDVLTYALFASVAFSTVVPALDATTRLTVALLHAETIPRARRCFTLAGAEVAAGVVSIVLPFIAPDIFFPMVWVGPFLILDGLVLFQGGRGILFTLAVGEWRLGLAVGLAGILCGALWEFWYFWANPQWVYHVPYLDFIHIFEMPLLGYLGYIPFAWSVYQLIHLPALLGYITPQDRSVSRPRV